MERESLEGQGPLGDCVTMMDEAIDKIDFKQDPFIHAFYDFGGYPTKCETELAETLKAACQDAFIEYLRSLEK